MRVTTSLVTFLLLTECSEGQPDTLSTNDVLIAANEAKSRAMVEGDFAVLENFYTADYQAVDGEGNVRDKKAQVDFLTRSIDFVHLESANVQVKSLSKNAALVTKKVSGRYQKAGQVTDFAEVSTSVWVTDHHQWRVRHEHSSPMHNGESVPCR